MVKKTSLIVLSLFILAGLYSQLSDTVGYADAVETITEGEVTASSLIIREEPSPGAASLGSYRQGDKVTIYESSGDWYKVKHSSGWGYVHSAYINASMTKSAPGEKASGKVTVNNLHVRDSPSTEGQIISHLSRGTMIELGPFSNGWYQVSIGTTRGYIDSSYIEVQSGSSSKGESTPASSSNVSEQVGSGRVTATRLNVRSSASTEAEIIGSLTRGTTVELLSESSGWYKVETENGNGYIHGSYVNTTDLSSGGNTNSSGQLDGKTIFVDAGHGGSDPGAIVDGISEKAIALDVSLKLRHALESEGANVVMSRTGDSYIEVGERAEMANAAGADLFISIHANAFTSSSVNGSEVFYSSQTYGDSSRQLAQAIQSQLVNGLNRADRGVVERDLTVLTELDMPGILIEPGFMSNSSDMDMLMNQQNQLVTHIVNGFKNY
ncbi:N-acetylmuramoyl-L-alanine amidase [Salipaludibacillus sp. LMS25]|jgi:N-acetylmuramoyl-L-alanine amidase|uniref:N-acetylmuramoyl-L-alanine amidase n=1 Tax=Salipaludibacillus sp. LMS25 TaxID=2924031 RepID=UPI0020D0962D|nr:N-acetylmuramoyl-L-alanine amidase [Salipaludibacillus sp. LMS25]UTR16198.1 N-acetylmuramoyl-L-alanine amidase [Salipaludibacillus sp. LMS25]